MSNKKAQLGSIWGTILLVGLLVILLFVGFLFAFGSAVFDWTMDLALPEFSGLGMVGDTNFTQISDITLTPMNSIVQSITITVLR